MSENKADPRTATQRIEDLEKVLTVLYQDAQRHEEMIAGLSGMKNDMTLVKDALKLINKRTDAIIQSASSDSGITSASVDTLVIQMNVAELVQQTANYVTAGHLAPTDTIVDNTFVVCEEHNSDGKVINPRIQFKLDTQDPATQESLKGKKAGDTVSFGENKFTVKVLEVYSLLDPNAPKAADPAPEAPAPDNSTGSTEPTTTAETTPEAPAEQAAPAAATEANPLPPETPVVQFVPSEPGMMVTAQ